MEIGVGLVVSAKSIWEELFKNFSGMFEVRIHRGDEIIRCNGGSVCLVLDSVFVRDIRVVDGVLVVECVVISGRTQPKSL